MSDPSTNAIVDRLRQAEQEINAHRAVSISHLQRAEQAEAQSSAAAREALEGLKADVLLPYPGRLTLTLAEVTTLIDQRLASLPKE